MFCIWLLWSIEHNNMFLPVSYKKRNPFVASMIYIYIYIVDIWINSCLNLWFIYILTCWYSYMPYCYVSICASVLLHCSRSWLDISIYICQVYCHGSTVISPLSCSLPCYFWSHNLYGQRSLFPCLLSHIRI